MSLTGSNLPCQRPRWPRLCFRNDYSCFVQNAVSTGTIYLRFSSEWLQGHVRPNRSSGPPKNGERSFLAEPGVVWLGFLLAPSKFGPDIDDVFNYGEVGSVRERYWTKATPCSVAKLRSS